MRKMYQPSPEIPPLALPRGATCVAACRSELHPVVMQSSEHGRGEPNSHGGGNHLSNLQTSLASYYTNLFLLSSFYSLHKRTQPQRPKHEECTQNKPFEVVLLEQKCFALAKIISKAVMTPFCSMGVEGMQKKTRNNN